ncbi:nuclear transport factor 2 family protein [Vibrio owensii]|uniref:nuclear transport factor 2 family protein n=1 Tax=Vibrio owensii TaxID=696485 RepID=UPI0031409FE4
MKLKQLWLLFIGVIAMNVNAQTMSLDEAKIRSNINSFSALADQGAFEYLGRLFAPVLTVDYTTLFGGEAQQVKRQDLMQQWAGFLPGFDATFHDLSNLNVSIVAIRRVRQWISLQVIGSVKKVSGRFRVNTSLGCNEQAITGKSPQ